MLEMGSYRDLDAYRLARSLIAVEPEAPPSPAAPRGLGRTALSVALHILDGTHADDRQERRFHLEASLAAVDRLADLIEDCEQRGDLPTATAEEMLLLQQRAAVSLERSLRDLEPARPEPTPRDEPEPS